MKTIIEELNELIDRKAQERTSEVSELQDKYDDLRYQLITMIENAKELKEDCDHNKLTVSSIEAEGYLRFALTVENLL